MADFSEHGDILNYGKLISRRSNSELSSNIAIILSEVMFLFD
jgi:hypothetical protein